MTEKECAVTKSIAPYREMAFDRALVRNGLTWLRVRGGLGGRGDRTDWMLDVPHTQAVVTRFAAGTYSDVWNYRYETFEEAIDVEVVRGLRWVSEYEAKHTAEALARRQSRETIEAATRSRSGSSQMRAARHSGR